MLITSTRNPHVLRIIQLSKASNRKESNLFTIEGLREIKKAFKSGIVLHSIYFCKEMMTAEGESFLREIIQNTDFYEVNSHVFEKIAYRQNQDGIVALAVPHYSAINDLVLSDNPFLLVIEKIEKPGNLGALLRTADAAGIEAVLVCDPRTDIYNPNVVRSSLGCVFSKNVIQCSSEEAITFLKANNIRIYSAALQTQTLYTSAQFNQACAVVFGSEADGLSLLWRESADEIIRIPMNGEADSLNVSVSAGIIIFEGVRQRSLS
jgi:RNA methyltransferase, TrmH family